MQFNLQRSIASSRDEVYEVVFQIERMRFFVGYHEMYRGQERDGEWKLLSNLGKKVTNVVQARQLEREMAADLAKRLKAEGLDIQTDAENQQRKYYQDWLLLQQAQYFGLPTRLMDWTAKWQSGLYYAVADPNNDDVDGQFWIYLAPDDLYASRSDINPRAYLDIDPYSADKPFFVNENSFWNKDYDRKMSVGRRFRPFNRTCIQPYDAYNIPLEEQEFHSQNLFKIIIPADAKSSIREELEKEGFNGELSAKGNSRIAEIVTDIKKRYDV